jgi:hypothetical protein
MRCMSRHDQITVLSHQEGQWEIRTASSGAFIAADGEHPTSATRRAAQFISTEHDAADRTTVAAAIAQDIVRGLIETFNDLVIVVADPDLQERLVTLMRAVIEDRERYEDVVETMMPRTVTVSPEGAKQAQRNAQLRSGFLSEQPLLNSAQVAALQGATASNASAAASRLVKAGRIFGVPQPGSRGKLFPAWQFEEHGGPRPQIKSVLSVLRPAGFSDWATALWFVSPTGWLDDRTPLDVLDDDADAVVRAAEQEITEVSG